MGCATATLPETRARGLIRCIVDQALPDASPSERWERVRHILSSALELQPFDRTAFLNRACGPDEALRAEVESLLAASEQSAFLDRPAELPVEGVDLDATVTITPTTSGTGLPSGTRIGHYEIIRKIGEGGMGAVYQATDLNLARPAALKLISHAYVSGDDKLRFIREAQAASALNHPNIITIYEYNSDAGVDFIAMEYVDGVSLSGLLAERTAAHPISADGELPTQLLGCARQVASALAQAHAAGITHRDLKPANVVVAKDSGLAKVLDFGLAKRDPKFGAESGMDPASELTRAGTVMGTPAYMSPEQALGEAADWRSDIFSFGVILYEMVCGAHPFRGANSVATLKNVVQTAPRPVRECKPAAPVALSEMIERCLVKDRDHRLQSLAEAVQVLDAHLAGNAAPAQTEVSRRTWIPAAIGTALVAIVAAVAFWPSTAPQVPTAPAVAVPPFTYSVEAQRPGGEPYTAALTDTFQAGQKFRLHLNAAQAGHVYVVNYGPGPTGAPRYWVLHPSMPGQTAAAGDQIVTSWYVFDQNPGTERLWMVWSQQPVALFEAPLGTPAVGLVDSPTAAAAIERLLAARDGIWAQLIELRHQ
jgi:serine/threonine protein kinase